MVVLPPKYRKKGKIVTNRKKEPKVIDAILSDTIPAASQKRSIRKNRGFAQKPIAESLQQAEVPVVEESTPVRSHSKKAAETSEKKTSSSKKKDKKPAVKIIPLGGLHEIGKNMTAYECGSDIVIVDCGMGFPEADMLGVDLVIPDFTYLEKNAEKIRGLLITHGHEDHIGSIPYFLKKLGTDIPIYGARLTLGLIEGKLKEHGLLGQAILNTIKPGDTVKLGCFSAEFIRVNHSIPDAVAIALTTPAGLIVQTGDFKIDYTPIQGEMIDLARFAELGKQGVLCLLSDSTNAERPGYTESERNVGRTFETLFTQAGDRRIIIATFSSNIHRIQQVIDAAYANGRKVAIIGRSMVNAVKTASELDYLYVPPRTLIDINEAKNYADHQLVIITTGSQGETMSALSRIASGEHKQINVKPDDKIIISASAIPGNEKNVFRVVNELMKKGADVVYGDIEDIHVSGHARQEELKLMLALTKPRFFMPVHGEFMHLASHRDLAVSMGMDKNDIFVMKLGEVLELNQNEAKVNGIVPTGQIMVDGLGVGDVGNIVLRDRKHLSEDGLMVVVVSMDKEFGTIVSGPDIISRGFVYVREAEGLMDEARQAVLEALQECEAKGITSWNYIKGVIKDTLKNFIWQKTKRSPMILPIIMDV
ncbi:MAG: ribonuclease J [Anaerotignum sp.]|nr:ribonuclease J [Anaerotignum sp.]